jgi:hypothetical protein
MGMVVFARFPEGAKLKRTETPEFRKRNREGLVGILLKNPV